MLMLQSDTHCQVVQSQRLTKTCKRAYTFPADKILKDKNEIPNHCLHLYSRTDSSCSAKVNSI